MNNVKLKEIKKIKIIKTSLKKITDNQNVINKINDISKRCNLISGDIYNFIKLYFLDIYESQNGKFPKINIDLLSTILNVVTLNKNKSGRKVVKNNGLEEKLKLFYSEAYKNIKHHKQQRDNLSHIYKYIFNGIITNFENNIKLHFFKYIKKLIRVHLLTYKFKMSTKKVYKITNIIYNNNTLPEKCDLDDEWIFNYINFILPKRAHNKTINDDVNKDPQKYLRTMVKMMRIVEDYNKNIVNVKEKIGLYNVFPSIKSYVSSYIPIDTTIIQDILLEGNSEYYKIKVADKRDALWAMFFEKLVSNKALFGTKKTKYVFGDLIWSDGIGVSIMKVTKNLYGSRIKRCTKASKGFQYLNDLETDDKQLLKNKRIVSVDPGKRNLVYLTDGIKKLRYTAMQRRFECGFRLKEKQIQKMKTQNIIKLEAELSKTNSKSCYKTEFQKYLERKEIVKYWLIRYYSNPFFRIQKWKSYIKNQCSEQKLVDNIKKTFGEDIFLAYGDWSANRQMKNYIPTKGVGLKRRLAKDFTIYNISEYNTSKKCCNCGEDNENFMVRKNPNPYKSGTLLVHGLLRCTNVNCGKYYDRDFNGSLNIRKIAQNALNGLERPSYLKPIKKQKTASLNEEALRITIILEKYAKNYINQKRTTNVSVQKIKN